MSELRQLHTTPPAGSCLGMCALAHFEPTGTRGYEDLRRDVVHMRVRDLDVPVASLADVIRSMEAAGRERDRAVLPGLRELLAREKRDH